MLVTCVFFVIGRIAGKILVSIGYLVSAIFRAVVNPRLRDLPTLHC